MIPLRKKIANELIEKKMDKEANRYIQQWPAEKITIENGRWGPFIRFGKKMLKIIGKGEKGKFTAEELAQVPFEELKKMIEAQIPDAFAKKAAAKKTSCKKQLRKQLLKKQLQKKR